MNKLFVLTILAMLFVGACSQPTEIVKIEPLIDVGWLATQEAKPTPDIVTDIATQQVAATPSAIPQLTPTPIPKRYTAVILGEDRSGTGTGPRTDVFVILVYQPKWNDLLIISVPRDLYVEYGGDARILCPVPWERVLMVPIYDRINRAYEFGSFDCVHAVVEYNFGLIVDSGIAAVDFEGFVELVDEMGGLTMEPRRMNGEQLLTYVRERMASGAINRDRRAIEVLLAMKEQWLEEQPIETISSLLPFALERVSVDLTFDAVVGMIELAKNTEDLNIRKVVFLYDQEVAFHRTEGGASVLLPIIDLRGWMDCLLSGHSSEACSLQHSLTDP